MMVVTTRLILALPILRPFQELLTLGLVKRMMPGSVITFISHQWLARAHPDPEGIQLRSLQRFIRAGTRDQIKEFFSERDWAAFKGAVSCKRLPIKRGHSELVKAFSRSGLEAPDDVLFMELTQNFFWLDYISVPQDEPPGEDGQLRAIRSIPYYIEQSRFFMVLCPSAMHAETGELCDYESWLRRGWCRLEIWANVLSHQQVVPVVLTDGSAWGIGIDAFFSLCGQARGAVVGCGEFTCCRWGHRRADGTPSLCDRDTVLPTLEAMWLSKVQKAAESRNLYLYAMFRAMETQLLARSYSEPFHATWSTGPADDTTADSVLDRIRGDCLAGLIPEVIHVIGIAAQLGDERLLQACVANGDDPLALDVDGDSCLRLACAQGSLAAVEYLLSLPSMTIEHVNLYNNNEMTALHSAVSDERIVDALLSFHASPSVQNFSRKTPLHRAARLGHANAVRVLLDARAPIDAMDMRGMTALHSAAEGIRLLGRREAGRLQTIQCLLSKGASPAIRDSAGLTACEVASRNHFHAAACLLGEHS